MSDLQGKITLPSTPMLLTQAGRERLFNNLTLLLAILGTLSFAAVLLADRAQNRALLVQVLIVVAFVWLLALLRPLPFGLRAGALLLLTMSLVWLTTATSGIATASRPLLLIGTLFAIAFFGRRGGGIALLVALVTFTALGMLQAGGALPVVTPLPDAQNWLLGMSLQSGMLLLAAWVLLEIVTNSQNVLERQQKLTRRLGVEQARQAEQVEERTRALRLAAEIGRGLTQILNPDDLYGALVSTVQQSFNFYYVQYFELDETGRFLLLRAGTGHAGQPQQRHTQRLTLSQGIVGRAATTRAPLLIGDLSDSSKFTANPLLPETKAELAVPVLVGETLLGVIDVQHHVPHALTANDANLLEIVAGQAGVALLNAQQYQEAEARARAAARRNRLRALLQGTSDVETLLRVAARELGDALQAEHTTIFVDTGLLAEPSALEAAP